MIHIQNLVKEFPQGPRVLEKINFRLPAGQSMALMGRSGSGKSTLLSLLCGLDRPTSGSVTVDGRDLNDLNFDQMSEFRAQNIGLIFQQFHLLPHLTAYENIRLPLDFTGSSEADERVQAMLVELELEERRNHLPQELSRGECQRVAIGRALVMRPRILLADEPTASLDDTTAASIIDLLFHLLETHQTTTLIATHDESLARRCQHQFQLKNKHLNKVEAA